MGDVIRFPSALTARSERVDTLCAAVAHGKAVRPLVEAEELDGTVELRVDAPLPTISAGGVHVAEVRALLAEHCGAASSPGLLTLGGATYQIVDVGMRMLQPHELIRAQFGEFSEGYDLSPATTKAAQVRLIGNSVCPHVVRALVSSNVRRGEVRAA